MTALRAILAVSLLCLCACSATPKIHGVPNLQSVRADYYRSGQPDNTDEAWGYLARDLGVTDEIKLNHLEEGSDTEALRHGVTVHYLPINPTSIVWWALASFGMTEVMRPDRATMDAIRKIILEIKSSSRRRVVLIHCTHGWDRTGLVTGMVLVMNGDMTKDQAWKYMLDTNFHRAHIGLWREWSAFEP